MLTKDLFDQNTVKTMVLWKILLFFLFNLFYMYLS